MGDPEAWAVDLGLGAWAVVNATCACHCRVYSAGRKALRPGPGSPQTSRIERAAAPVSLDFESPRERAEDSFFSTVNQRRLFFLGFFSSVRCFVDVLEVFFFFEPPVFLIVSYFPDSDAL